MALLSIFFMGANLQMGSIGSPSRGQAQPHEPHEPYQIVESCGGGSRYPLK